MLRIISLLLFCILLVPFFTQVQAVDSNTDAMLTDILKDTNKELLNELLSINADLPDLQGLDILDQPKLLIISTSFFQYADRSLEDAVTDSLERSLVKIVVLNETPTVIFADKAQQHLSVSKEFYTNNAIPRYVLEVINGKATQFFLGQNCNIQNVICFEDFNSHKGGILIFETNRGRFVRYYHSPDAEIIEYAWNDFIPLAIGYKDVLSSGSYDLFGNPTVGSPSFVDYLKNPDQYLPEMPFWQKCLIGVGIVTSVVGTVFVGIRLRKCYLRRKYAYFDIEI